MLVASNATDLFDPPRECGDMVTDLCSEVIYIWAFGVGPDCFDDQYGVRIGQSGFKTVVFEIHWNNPQELQGETDSSGVRFYYTPQLRQYDAQTLFFGPLYLELPPGQSKVKQGSRCTGDCITSIFNGQTVYIPQIIPHMHYTGKS